MMKSAALFAILSLLSTTQAYFILSQPLLVHTREDPIINPGTPSSHEHTIVGGSMFDTTLNYNKSISASCTTAPVTLDLSSYWTPTLYYYNPDADNFQIIDLANVNTYYLNRPGKDGKVVAPPKGLKMIVGSPTRRTYNPSSVEDQAISFVCLGEPDHQNDPDYAQRHDFFDHQCHGGLRMQANFPNCWNGVDLDSDDHKKHMAFSSGGPDGNGECPSTHPVKIVEVFYEFVYNVQNFPFNNASYPTWCLANGDCTGLGMHADYVMGWKDAPDGTSVLQAAIDQCNTDYHDGRGPGIGGVLTNCPPFVPYLQSAYQGGCRIENPVVNEDNGQFHPIPRLPGNNPIWIGNGTKPSYGNYSDSGVTYSDGKSKIAAGWTDIGCVADSVNGRALTAASYVDKHNMTRGSCVAYCDSLSMPYAGVEFGQECYCGFTLSNGATNTTIDARKCGNVCAGNQNEDCGGAATLELFTNPAYIPKPVGAPAGWTALGCYTDKTSNRTLPKYSFASSNMTYALCTSGCAAKGYSIAGIEYAQECWCANSFAGAGAPASDPSTCSMSCSGDKFNTCGGPDRLTVFSKGTPAPVSSSSALASSSLASSASSSLASSASSVTSANATTATLARDAKSPATTTTATAYSPPYYRH